ncbi:C-type lectin domain family 4 member M-like [Haliotis rufescens]|uniref:C-type lectin domain family 4 member M-like n=1 Tax=Haliotis rufescens TaxID=6454 RepID=UPI00201E760A|nr:C-type lectin domain family 4 member M-like [Haliotis rufescens]
MSEECVIYQRLVSTTDDFTLFPSVIVFALCPSGYSGLGRRCIKVVTEKMDWDSARAHCRDDNADLITLESQAKMNEFRDFMATNGHESDNGYYWCAASKVSDGWQWINGKTFSNSALWCDGEPNFPNDEECASTRDPAFNCYYDDSCNENLKFVCEVQF